MKNSYILPLPDKKFHHISRIWLYLAVFSIAIAGLFSLPPVMLRKSNFADFKHIEEIFSTSLILHVNLSVLVWLLAVSGMLWSLAAVRRFSIFNAAAPLVCFAGAVLISLSPFIADSIPLKNNYIPVLINHWFFMGLGIFASGIIIQVLLTLLDFGFLNKKMDENYAQRFGVYTAALITLSAILCFMLSRFHIYYFQIRFSDAEQFYETLFWAGGHILQFVYVQMMVFAWLWLAESAKLNLRISVKQLGILYFIGVVIALPAPLIHIDQPVDSWFFKEVFTSQMKYGGGIAALFAGIVILFAIPKIKREKSNSLQRNCLFFSMIMFFVGGLIGFGITGNNAQVPAHYHGSIVAVTLAFMGIIYDVLPKLGFKKPTGFAAVSQPIVYGIGQLMHVSGLALMGGYGALRKAPGTSDQIDTLIGKLLFFSGGALAIIGGFLFVYVAVKAIIRK